MVDTAREYVLQWPGHAESVTERFSGLFARQALVDVTLLCQEQKLRVHKLVLASCSLYFEEMLEQDLGQEPIILLKDLDFNILKAMVEFMYCGETTIAHCHLQSLLDAAQVFKVKDLESLVTSMLYSKSATEPDAHNLQDPEPEEPTPACSSICSPSEPPEISILEPDTPDIPVSEPETPANIFEDSTSICDHPPESVIAAPSLKTAFKSFEAPDPYVNPSDPTSPVEMPEEPPEDITHHSDDQSDVPTKIGQCLRVYTHKKRKSTEDRKMTPSLPELLSEPLPTDCIDLAYDKNCDTTPVTLPSLDLLTDYIFTINTDSIQSTNTTNPTNFLTDRYKNIYDNLDIHKFAVPNYKNLHKELFSTQNHIETTPVLRRSVRLNQLENDDTVNNNETTICQKPKEYRKVELTKIKAIKPKRKIKDADSRISDENRKHVINGRSSRTRKITKNIKKCLARDESNRKSTKLKNVKLEKMEVLEHDACPPVKLNTIATVDRSLWGDMSDLIENCQHSEIPSDYTHSREIPFAVGLLPLRAALERMQAIPDYQPRKTRSSVAPFNSCPVKRKINGDAESIVVTKRDKLQDNLSDSSTVCHIQIHASSQCSREEDLGSESFMPVESTSEHR